MDAILQNYVFQYINSQTPFGLVLLTTILIWSAILKGLGLWKAARNNERIWFIAILILNTVGILEIAYLFFFAKEKFTVQYIRDNIKSYKIHNFLKRFYS